MAREAFHPLDPETAQFDMAVEDYAALLAELKPRFIHHPESKRLIQEMLADFGATPSRCTSTCRGCAARRRTTT